ncbi:MAG: hypothetical protein ABSH35_24385 [Isosphaeraceae bacterium]
MAPLRPYLEAYLGPSNGNATDTARMAGYRSPEIVGRQVRSKSELRAALDARMATAARAASVVLARITDVASRDLLNLLPATGRTYLLSSATAVNHRRPPSLTRAELGTNGLTGWGRACREM